MISEAFMYLSKHFHSGIKCVKLKLFSKMAKSFAFTHITNFPTHINFLAIKMHPQSSD